MNPTRYDRYLELQILNAIRLGRRFWSGERNVTSVEVDAVRRLADAGEIEWQGAEGYFLTDKGRDALASQDLVPAL